MRIRIENATQERIPRQHVLARMRRLVSAVDGSAVTARVSFSDVNGPKGAGIRCALLVCVPRSQPIVVGRVGTTPRLAFDATYDGAARRLDQARMRRRDARRRPKKYYVAKRALS